MTTTLNQIRKHSPCEDSWKKLLLSLGKTEADDEPLELQHILDTLGVEDAIWALRSLEGADREIRLFACECAESVLPIYEAKYPTDDRPRKAIEVGRKYANGEATEGELTAAGGATWDATWAAGAAAREAAREAARAAARAAVWAARDAARAAARAAAGAAGAAAGAAGAAERAKQAELFKEYFCKVTTTV